MPRKTTPSFIFEVELIVASQQEKELDARFNAGLRLYNACLGEAMRRMELVRNSEEYKAAKKLPKTIKNDSGEYIANPERKEAFIKARQAYRYSDFDIQAFATQTAKASKWIAEKLDSNTQQKLATRAFNATEKVLFGRAKDVRFKVFNSFKSLEGKTNKQGIRWIQSKKNASEYFLVWGELQLTPIMEWLDPVFMYGLNSHVKYTRLVKRRLNGKTRYYAQMVCEGTPYQKPQNKVADGLVGIDLNISNVAFVADEKAGLLPFAEKVPTYERELKALQRKMSRSERSNNPDNFEPDFDKKVGRKVVKKKGKAKKGKRQWKNSRNYRKLQQKRQEILRRKTAYTKSENRRLVNDILRYGNIIKAENVSVRGWHKRYGKAISAKSPGFFQSELERKAESAGGQFITFSTRKTALSQTHLDGKTRIKKSLSERVHKDVSGFEMHRDLFSAFLARNVNDSDELQAASQIQSDWERTEPFCTQAWREHRNRERVGESESRLSHSSAERVCVERKQPSQIVCEGEKLGKSGE
jgi:putative transposase